MPLTDHEHTFLGAARCACGVDYSDVLDLLFAARGDAERVAGEAHYTGACLRPESETLELWLFDAPSQVLQELEATRPGVYLIHNDAPRPRAALGPLTHSFDFAPMQSEGIVVTRVSVSEDGYLQVDVVDDVQTAQMRLDRIYGSDLVRVVQGGYGIPGRVIASFPDRHFQFWERANELKKRKYARCQEIERHLGLWQHRDVDEPSQWHAVWAYRVLILLFIAGWIALLVDVLLQRFQWEVPATLVYLLVVSAIGCAAVIEDSRSRKEISRSHLHL